jgi:hypothetical protein
MKPFEPPKLAGLKRGPNAVERAAERDVIATKVAIYNAVTDGRTRMIRLDDITVPPVRMRQLHPEKVDEFAESIAARGRLQPIIIRPQDSGYVLVVGSHRLEAVRKLGHEAIVASSTAWTPTKPCLPRSTKIWCEPI